MRGRVTPIWDGKKTASQYGGFISQNHSIFVLDITTKQFPEVVAKLRKKTSCMLLWENPLGTKPCANNDCYQKKNISSDISRYCKVTPNFRISIFFLQVDGFRSPASTKQPLKVGWLV